MKAWKVLSALALLSPAVSYATCAGTWTKGAATTAWATTGNWSLVGGTCGAYPGANGTTDTAAFTATGAGAINVNASPLNLNQLSFTGAGYTLSGNTITFTGTTPTLTTAGGFTTSISDNIVLDFTSDTDLTITLGNNGDVLTLSGTISDEGLPELCGITVPVGSAASAQLNLQGATLGSGGLGGPCTFNNSITNITSQFNCSNILTVGGGTVAINNSNTATPSCNQPNFVGSDVQVTGGTVTLNSANGCSITTGNGAQFGGNNFPLGGSGLTVSGGTISGQNTSAVSTAGGGSTGVLVGAQVITLNGGTVTLNNGTMAGPNGTISGNATNAGAALFDTNTGGSFPLTINGATVTLTNWGPLSGLLGTVPAGVKVVSGVGTNTPANDTMTISAGTLTLINNSSSLSSYGNGCYLMAPFLIVSSTGSTEAELVLTNSATSHTTLLTNAVSGIINGDISINGMGSMTATALIDVSNDASLDLNSAGTGASLSGASFTIPSSPNSEFSLFNGGAISGGVGASLIISGPISLIGMAGKAFNVENSGAIATNGTKGAWVQTTGALTLGGEFINIENSGTVSTVTNPGYGCMVQAASIGSMSGGSQVRMVNDVAGVISGNAGNIGAYLYSHGTFTYSGVGIAAGNSANVGPGTGVQIQSDMDIEIQNGISTLLNAGTITGAAVGSQIITGTALNFNGGVLELSNGGTFLGTGGIGVNVQVGTSSTLTEGDLIFANTGNVNNGALAGVQYLVLGSGGFNGNTSISLPDMEMSNNSTVSSTTSGAAGAILTTTIGPIILSMGDLMMDNQGSVTSATGYGVAAIATANTLTLGANNGTISNEASVSSATTGYGALLQGTGLTISTSADLIAVTNSGTISTSASNAGVMFMATTSDISMTGPAGLTMTNSGSVAVGSGVALSAPLGALNMSNGTLSLINSGIVSSGFGAKANVGTNLALHTSFNQLNITNSGPSTGGTSASVIVDGTFSMTTGAMTVSNSGVLSGAANGALLQVNGGSFVQTGGTITVQNTGAAGTGNASCIQSTPTIQIMNSGTTFNNPNALVAASAVTISNLGTLQSGTPTVPGVFQDATFGSTTVVTNNGGVFVSGTLDPTPGQTTVNGTFTQNSGTYTVVIGDLTLPGNQGVSFLTVDGTGVINFNGGTLLVVPATGFVPSDVPASINMVQFGQALSTVNGGFTPTQIINTVPGLFDFSYETIGGNQAWLIFTHSPPLIPIPPNGSPPINPGFPIIVTTFNTVNNFLDNEFLRIQDQFDNGGQSLCDGGARAECRRQLRGCKPKQTPHWGRKEKSETELSLECPIKPWHVYLGPIGETGKVNNKGHLPGADFTAVGGLAGVDYAAAQVGGGLLLDYEHINADLHKHNGHFDIDQVHVTAYSTYVPPSEPRIAVNGQFGMGGAWYDVHRHVAAPTGNETAKGHTRGLDVTARAGMQYSYSNRSCYGPCNWELIPAFNLQYLYQGVAGYREHGAGISDYKYKSETYQSLRSTLGTRFWYIVRGDNYSIMPMVNLGWQFEYLDQSQKTRAKPINFDAPSKSLTIYGGARNTLLAGLSLAFEFYRTCTVEAIYNFEYNSYYHNNSLVLDLNVSF